MTHPFGIMKYHWQGFPLTPNEKAVYGSAHACVSPPPSRHGKPMGGGGA